jgi:hypothetical protein
LAIASFMRPILSRIDASLWRKLSRGEWLLGSAARAAESSGMVLARAVASSALCRASLSFP